MFVYIDESGHPHPNDPHPRPVDLAVCLKREDVRQIMGALHRFSEDFRASLPSTTQIRSDEREGKATAFLSRKQWSAPVKRVYADSVMDLIRNLDVTIFAMVMERPDRPIYRGRRLPPASAPMDPREGRCADRTEGAGRLATLVFDGRERSENIRLDKCFSNFLFRSAEGRALARIVPGCSSWTRRSHRASSLQTSAPTSSGSTTSTGSTGRSTRQPLPDDIKRYAEIIRQKTFDWEDEDGVRSWGIRTMGKEHFRYPE